jgi:flagellar basal body-associated protein FliL
MCAGLIICAQGDNSGKVWSRMRLLLLAVFFIAALLGGGGVVYIYFGGSNAAHAADASHGSSGKTKGGMEFVEISPLVFPLINDNGAHQMISLVVSIEVNSKEAAENITRLTPRLNDAYIQSLYGFLNRHVASRGGIIEINEVKKRLNEVTSKVVGNDGFNDVLLQVVQQHPI